MHRRLFSLLSALVAFVLVFTLALPVAAFADDGQPGDPTPEATEEAPWDEAAQQGATEETAPTEVVTEEVVTEEAITEEAVPAESASEEAAVEAAAPEAVVTGEAVTQEETVADVIELLAETDSVLVDESGEPISLASEEAVEILTTADPSGTLDAIVGAGFGLTSDATFSYFKSDDTHSNGTCINDLNTDTRTCWWDTPLQKAIDDASEGTTVQVEAGTYTEQIQINKNLTLAGSAGAIIKSPTSLPTTFSYGSQIVHPVIYVSSGNVTITGFTVDGADYSGNGRFAGIAYNNARGSITDSTITNFFDASDTVIGYGIYIGNTAGVSILQNSITNNEIGVYTKDKDTTINNNNIIDNETSGVWNDSSGSQAGTVDAQYDYWGCSGGANTAGCDTKSSRVDSRFYLTSPIVQDADEDGVADAADNCAWVANPGRRTPTAMESVTRAIPTMTMTACWMHWITVLPYLTLDKKIKTWMG